jgi:hypothetical protein
LNEDLHERRRGVCELFHAAELAFEKIGHYAIPCMIDRLLAEDSHDSGFINRMSVLRGLHCTQHMSPEAACCMLSEWVCDRNLDGERFANVEPGSDFAVANTVPLTHTVMDRFHRTGMKGFTWSVLHNYHGSIFVTFGLRPDSELDEEYCETASDLLHADGAAPRKVESKLASQSGDNQEPLEPMEVHGGFWNILDNIWTEVRSAILAVIRREETFNLMQLVFCGSGLGGAVAKVAALRICLEEDPLDGLKLKTDSSDPSWGVQVVLYTYGAPHIKVERNNRKHIQLHHHCSTSSRSWRLAGDPMPLMLSEHSHAIISHYTQRAGICCRRRQYQKNGFLHSYVRTPHHTSHHFKSVVKTDKLEPADIEAYKKRMAQLGRHEELRADAFSEALSNPRAYTNAMCWRDLCRIMPPKNEEQVGPSELDESRASRRAGRKSKLSCETCTEKLSRLASLRW